MPNTTNLPPRISLPKATSNQSAASITRMLSLIAVATAVLAASPVASTAESQTTAPTTAFKGGATSSGWIDFDLYNNSIIFIPVKIDGHDAIAMLNYGLPSKIDKRFAVSTGLQSNPSSAASTSANSVTSISGIELQVGDLIVHEIAAPVDDLANKIGSHPYNFYLGDDVLNQVALDIDFANHRLAFLNPASVTKPTGAQELPLVQVGTGLSVPVAIDGEGLGLFHIEFANSAPLMVTHPYSQSHDLLTGHRVSQRYTGPTKEPEGMATLNRVTFAGTDFPNIPTVIVPDSLLDPKWFDGIRLSGVVGMPLLSRFHLIFDPTHDRLYALASPAEALHTPFPKDRLGLSFNKAQDGDLAVAFVAPGSPAQLAGIKVGDSISKIDGEPVATIKSLSLSTRTDVAFTLANGEIRGVKLAEYY